MLESGYRSIAWMNLRVVLSLSDWNISVGTNEILNRMKLRNAEERVWRFSMKFVPEEWDQKRWYLNVHKTAFGSWPNRQKTTKTVINHQNSVKSKNRVLFNIRISNAHFHEAISNAQPQPGALPLGPRRRLPPRTPLSGAAAPEPPQYANIQTNSNKRALRTIRTCSIFIRIAFGHIS